MKTKEQISAYGRARYKANPKRFKAEAKAWQKANQKKYKRYTAEWQKRHPERRKAYKAKRRTAKTKAGGAYTSAQWIALCDKYHKRCVCCGKKRKLTSDHVVPVSKGGSSNISNIQPLCLPCNSRKGTKTTDYR
jgi:5-methylcytosine-specific restriction endonuclease McrA